MKNVEEIKTKSNGLVWFTKNLRVQDNTLLKEALNKHQKVFACYFLDPRHFQEDRFGFKKTGPFRTKFLLESLRNLSSNLAAIGIELQIFQEYPEKKIPLLVDNLSIQDIYLQKEWTSEEMNVTNAVKKACHNHLNWTEAYDQFLLHPEDLPLSIPEIPKVFTTFRKKVEKTQVRTCETLLVPKENALKNNQTSLPFVKELGHKEFNRDHRTAFPFEGGESNALKRLNEYFWETENLSSYKKTRNGLLGKEYSSKLSAWLALGCISARTIYHEVKKYEKEVVKNDSTYWLIFELLWRDFFKYISLKHGNAIFQLGGILQKEYTWTTEASLMESWIHGTTQEAFVNANMLELKHTGWMSNRGRQNVASYLAKTLQMDWRMGAAYFESQLIDYDVHSNYGNWMYVAGVGNDPRDRVFNVSLQAERYDPEQKFQERWLS